MLQANLPQMFLDALRPRVPAMLADLRDLVECESPSVEKAPADRCCSLLAEKWRKRGARIERIPQKYRGDHLRVTWQPAGSRVSGQLMVLGHYDTVYGTGTLAKMPFRIKRGKAFGPGTFDMKGGLVQALFALETLQKSRVALTKRLVFVCRKRGLVRRRG